MTDDDICGYEGTTTGKPCQHPAGSCPVPSHADETADNPQGRDFSLSDDDHEAILNAARQGFSETGCARAAGVSWPELDRYLQAHPEFRSAFRRARHEGEKTLVRGPLINNPNEMDPSATEIDGQHARFLLASSFDYKKTETREVTGEDGAPIAVTSDVVEVTESDE